MPSAGYSHFYQDSHSRIRQGDIWVSMPSAGYSHFYLTRLVRRRATRLCQCPRRAILISTGRDLYADNYYDCNVSMPSAGYSHFYQLVKDCWRKMKSGCQCPRRAILISTILFGIRTELIEVCQCPRRAILISTMQKTMDTPLNGSCVSMPSAGYSHFYQSFVKSP